MLPRRFLDALITAGLLLNGLDSGADEHISQERAITQGLKWLADRQGNDGEWAFDTEQDAEGRPTSSTSEATALAVLAFLGAGQTVKSKAYGETVNRALAFLAASAAPTDEGLDLRGDGGTLTAHAIAGVALCESCGMQKETDESIRQVAQAAVEQSQQWQSQNAAKGWGIEPDGAIHIRSTVWHLMLLRSAQRAGLRVNDQAIPLGVNSLRRLQTADERNSSEAPYFGFTFPEKDPAATALGVYGHLLSDWSAARPWVWREADYLLSRPDAERTAEERYFCTEVLHGVAMVKEPAENRWESARAALVDQLARDQITDGTSRGSWQPRADGRGHNSRLAITAFNLMSLEVYYGFRPLSFRQRAKAATLPSNADLLAKPPLRKGE